MAKTTALAKKNILKSLENQSNKNFEVIFSTCEKFFSEDKYSFIFSTLKDTDLTITFVKDNDWSLTIKDTYDEYDYVIQSRMDYDDFAYKDAVTDIQSKVDECDSLLSYGYCNGFTYLNGEMYSCSKLFAGGHASIMQTLILKSSFVKDLPFISPYTFNNAQVKAKLKTILEQSGKPFIPKAMFKQNISTNAFIWFRHDVTASNRGKPIMDVPKGKQLTTADITKKQLKETFGFDGYELKSIK